MDARRVTDDGNRPGGHPGAGRRGARALPRIRALARHRPVLPGVRAGARELAGRLRAAAWAAPACRGRRRPGGLRGAATARRLHVRDEAPLRAPRVPRAAGRPPTGGARRRRGALDRLRAHAARHAPVHAGGDRALPGARLRRDRAVHHEPRAGGALHGARPLLTFERRRCRRNRFLREVAAGNRWGVSGGAALAPPDLNQARAGSATDMRSARQSGIVTSTASATTMRVGPTPTASPRSPYTVGADDEAPTESV